MVKKFENRLLQGNLNVTCKFDDGSIRIWSDRKENVVANIISIVDNYSAQGYKLSLRQLHYQFVGHVSGYVNHDLAYKKLGKILDDCRYGGVIDWNAIEDRGRVPYLPYWVSDISDALSDTVNSYRLDLQKGQDNIIEVWTEKDALSGIMKRSTEKYHVNLVVNKGYTSSSAVYNSYKRFGRYIDYGKKVIILYFGDHDPSGLDMVRDIEDRLKFMFANGDDKIIVDDGNFEVIHIGLTMQQIKKYKLPPNPTKMTDTRSDGYIKKYGKTCWEVDALAPEVLTQILEKNIEDNIDMELYQEMIEQQDEDIKELKEFINKHE